MNDNSTTMFKWLGITDEPKGEEAVKTKTITHEQFEKTISNESDVAQQDDRETNIAVEPITTEPVNALVKVDDDTQSKVDPEKDSIQETAQQLGNFFYGFATAASKTASKIKETVDDQLEKTLVGELTRENERFVQEKHARRLADDSCAPWVGFHQEETMKKQILALSMDERNFLRDPPSGVDYHFELEVMMPVALVMIREDPDLEPMRFKLVPRRVIEARFWKNYFYRVSLIKQSTQLSAMNELDKKAKVEAVSTVPITPDDATDISEAATEDGGDNDFASDIYDDQHELSESERQQMFGGVSSPTSASDLDLAAEADAADASEDAAMLTTTNGLEEDSYNVDELLEKELLDEIESFELVSGGSANTGDTDDTNWEKEIEDMLEEEVVTPRDNTN